MDKLDVATALRCTIAHGYAWICHMYFVMELSINVSFLHTWYIFARTSLASAGVPEFIVYYFYARNLKKKGG